MHVMRFFTFCEFTSLLDENIYLVYTYFGK